MHSLLVKLTKKFEIHDRSQAVEPMVGGALLLFITVLLWLPALSVLREGGSWSNYHYLRGKTVYVPILPTTVILGLLALFGLALMVTGWAAWRGLIDKQTLAKDTENEPI